MSSPFDLDQPLAYARWRATKLTSAAACAQDLIVDVADPARLTPVEHQALMTLCAATNMAIYRSPVAGEDKGVALALGAQMGLDQLDGNWLADEDAISSITVAAGDRAAFIPYTNRPIKWHTDGYYHPAARRIQAMVLHCVRRAAQGGESTLMDHEMAYIALRDANPAWIRALMVGDVMTIPERTDEHGVARPAQTGSVFSLDPASGALHMRYTARTRSVVWKDDGPTRAAVAGLEQLLASDGPPIYRLTLQPGMGLVCNNVLHDRSGFVDDPQQPRLLYRLRYLDRIDTAAAQAGWPVPGPTEAALAAAGG